MIIIRKLAFVLVVGAFLAFPPGCSVDATAPDAPASDTGATKGKRSGSTARDGSETEPTDDVDPSGDDDRSPEPPQRTSGKKENGAQCAESADCKSDFCVFQGNGLGMCTTTCDGDIDCDLSWTCTKLSNAPQKVCVPE